MLGLLDESVIVTTNNTIFTRNYDRINPVPLQQSRKTQGIAERRQSFGRITTLMETGSCWTIRVYRVQPTFDAVAFIRPPAAALLAYSSLGGLPEEWRLAAALIAGSIALTSHGTKATTRAAVNASPEPISNSVLSMGEDGLAVFLAWMAATHPVLTLVIVLALVAVSIYVVIKLSGFVRRGLRKLFRREPSWLPPSSRPTAIDRRP